MRHLIAAIDTSAAARPVLAAAREIARLLGEPLVALTVCDDTPGQSTTDIASALEIPLLVRYGEPIAQIAAAVTESPDVDGVVVGSRGLPTSRRPVGHIALALIQELDTPVVVVPPTADVQPGQLRRLLVPLDGTHATATAADAFLRRLEAPSDLDVIALHVFDSDEIPAFSDHAGHETTMWTHEFLQRWLPDRQTEVTIETRVGRAGDAVRKAARDLGADFVVVAWKRDLSPGRAEVISTLLANGDIPIVLLPTVGATCGAGPAGDRDLIGGP